MGRVNGCVAWFFGSGGGRFFQWDFNEPMYALIFKGIDMDFALHHLYACQHVADAQAGRFLG